MAKDIQAEVMAHLDARKMAETEKYLRAGRKFRDASNSEVLAIWKKAFEEFVSDVSNADANALHEGAEAELRLRGIVPPYEDEDVKPIAELFIRQITELHNSSTAEDLTEANKALEADMNVTLGRGQKRN